MKEEDLILTPGQAESLLSDDEYIHTFRNAGFALVGADWEKDELVKEIKKCKCEIGGSGCRGMGHGLVIWTSDSDPLFVETRKNAPEEFEEAQKQQLTSLCQNANDSASAQANRCTKLAVNHIVIRRKEVLCLTN